MSALLLEHHGKSLFRAFGIDTPRGVVVSDAASFDDADLCASGAVAVKAQVRAGGRGKGGGILFARDGDEVRVQIDRLLACPLNGETASSVLVEQRVSFEFERYAAIAIEGNRLILIFGSEGGIDVEDITGADAANVATVDVDPIDGPDEAALRQAFTLLGYEADYFAAYTDLARKLHRMTRSLDLTLAEINPLVELDGGRLVALDAKVAVDDLALGRQPEIAAMLARREVRAPGDAELISIRSVSDAGNIGLIGLGTGLNLAIMDWVENLGAGIRSMVDVDHAIFTGRANEGFAAAVEAYDDDPDVKAILINVITSGYRLDDITASLIPALRIRDPKASTPVVLHLSGNAMERTPRMLGDVGWSSARSLGDAIRDAVHAAGNR